MSRNSRTGSVLVLCLGILILVAALAFGFLRMVSTQEDTNAASTRLLMAQEAAQTGRIFALEGILRDYGEIGSFVHNATAPDTSWSTAANVRVQRLGGSWMAPLQPITMPNQSNVMMGTYPIDEVTGDGRLDSAMTSGYGLLGGARWYEDPAFDRNFVNSTGRGRYFEIENYDLDALTSVRSGKSDGGVQQTFGAITGMIDSTTTRGAPGYYDSHWRAMTDPPQSLAADQAREAARYRLRFAVMVEDLDGHVPMNATGMDQAAGRDVRETDPYNPTIDAIIDSKYGNLNAATRARAKVQLRRTIRYTPSIFNLSYTSNPATGNYYKLPWFFSLMVGHIFQGRGMAANVDRSDVGGYPVTWPLMYRRGVLDGLDPGQEQPAPCPTLYNVWPLNPYADKGGNTIPHNLYTDNTYTQQLKYGGNPVNFESFGNNAWTFPGAQAGTLWHGLMGRMVSFTSQYIALGAQFNWQTTHPMRAWTNYFLTPFRRGLELYIGGESQTLAKRWKADVDTPMHVNLLTCPPMTIHAMTMAYLPPGVQKLDVRSVSIASGGGATFATGTYSHTMPAYDLFDRYLWKDRTQTESAFNYPPLATAPRRVTADGVIEPDWNHTNWLTYLGNDRYPGGAVCPDLPSAQSPTTNLTDCGPDDTGILIRTDNVRYNGDGSQPINFGMRGQGVDTLAGRGFLFLPNFYTVTPPDKPPGWDDLRDASGNPITDAIWLQTGSTSSTTVSASGLTTTSTSTGFRNSATVTYNNGGLAGFGHSYWGDLVTALHTAITVARAQWTQQPGNSFDPYWENDNPGDPNRIYDGRMANGNRDFRRDWDPASYADLAAFDRVFLAQLGIDIDLPDQAVVTPGWLVSTLSFSKVANGIRVVPRITVLKNAWDAGYNIRMLAGVAGSSAVLIGTPAWQREQELANDYSQLYPTADPPDPAWGANESGVAAYVTKYATTYGLKYGLAFAKAANGTVMSSRLRTAAMEMMLNDLRYSFFGSSPGYHQTFRPLDFNGDGLVNCSAYPPGNAPTSQETYYHLDHYVAVNANGKGRSIDPQANLDAPFCIAGNFFIGKSRFYRIITRGEVWDNVLGRVAATSLLDSAVCVDTADQDTPKNLKSAHLLFQRWVYDPKSATLLQAK